MIYVEALENKSNYLDNYENSSIEVFLIYKSDDNSNILINDESDLLEDYDEFDINNNNILLKLE